MSDEDLQRIRRETRRLKSEKVSDRIKKDIAAYRDAVVDIGKAPADITAAAIKLGIGEDLIDQAIAKLQEAKQNSDTVKKEVVSRAYHLAETALSIDGTTQDLANLMQIILSERFFLEMQSEALVAVLRATNKERMGKARDLLRQIDSSKHRELFGE